MFALRCSAEQVTLESEAAVRVHASSATAERGFCADCASQLFFRARAGEHRALPAGPFAHAAGWRLAEQIFVDDPPDFYCLSASPAAGTRAP